MSCLGLKSVIPSSSWICRSLAIRRSSRGVMDDKQFVKVRCCDLCNLELYTLYVISKTIFNSTYSMWQYCSSIDKSHRIIQIYNVGVPWEMWPFCLQHYLFEYLVVCEGREGIRIRCRWCTTNCDRLSLDSHLVAYISVHVTETSREITVWMAMLHRNRFQFMSL